MSAAVRSSVTVSGTVEQVFAVLTSEGWVATRAERFADGSTVLRREQRPGSGLLLAVRRELPAGAPGFLTRLLPQDAAVVQTDEWAPADASGARSGTWRVEISGAPARLGGTMRLDPVADGGAPVTAYALEGQAKVSVPLVGGKAEAYIADMVQRLAAREGVLLAEALRGG